MRFPLSIPPGIFSDDTSFNSRGKWEDGSNVRFWMRIAQVIGGWSKTFSTALTGKCRNALAWTNLEAYLNLAFGTHSHLFVYVGGELADITPSGLAAGAEDGAGGPGYGAGGYGEGGYGEPTTGEYWPRTWSLATWGQNLMASPRGGTLYVWENDAGTAATAVTDAPAEITYMLIPAGRRQVLALGCSQYSGGVFNPLCIRGSGLTDYTEWNPGSGTTSFEYVLEGGGRIVAAREMGPYVAIWTDNAVHLAQYEGSETNDYRVDLVGAGGLIGPNAVAVVGQTAFWIGPDYQFRYFTVGGAPAIIPCPIRNDFADNIAEGQFDKIVASSVSKYNEIWFHYPDARDGNENSRGVGLCISPDGSEAPWFKLTMDRTAFIDAGAAQYPIGVDASGAVYDHEKGHTANGGPLTYFLKSASQYFGEAERWTELQGVWPDFETQLGPVSLTIYSRDKPQSDDREWGPYALSASTEKMDLRCSGRVFSIKLSGSSAPAYIGLGKLEFDISVRGTR